ERGLAPGHHPGQPDAVVGVGLGGAAVDRLAGDVAAGVEGVGGDAAVAVVLADQAVAGVVGVGGDAGGGGSAGRAGAGARLEAEGVPGPVAVHVEAVVPAVDRVPLHRRAL